MIKTNTAEFLNKTIKIKIDRPLGSHHPHHSDIAYEVNYGFVPNTLSGDGEEVDCYLLGVDYPVEEFEGRCIAVVRRLEDDDDKLIIAPAGTDFTDEAIEKKIAFQERFFRHVLIR